MFWIILLTVVICCLLFLIYEEYAANVRLKNKVNALKEHNRRLAARNKRYHDFELKRLCHEKYKKGLDDGGKCDTLYKQIVSKFDKGEQFTVMVRGGEIVEAGNTGSDR